MFKCLKCKDTGYESGTETRKGLTYSCVWVCDCKYPKMKEAAFGEKFKDKTLENYEGRTSSMESAKLKLITNPDKSYFITGAVGLGKTHLMAGIYDRLVRKYGTAIKVFTEEELSEKIRNKEEDVKPKTFKMVMIDDMGKIELKDWQYDKFFAFFDGIYKYNRKLIISSNYTILEIVKFYGGAIARRIDENCEIIEIKGIEQPELFDDKKGGSL